MKNWTGGGSALGSNDPPLQSIQIESLALLSQHKQPQEQQEGGSALGSNDPPPINTIESLALLSQHKQPQEQQKGGSALGSNDPPPINTNRIISTSQPT